MKLDLVIEIAKIRKLVAQLAEKRDEIRGLIDELEDINEVNDRALEALEIAADALSEHL